MTSVTIFYPLILTLPQRRSGERLPNSIFRYVFSGFLQQGHDDSAQARSR